MSECVVRMKVPENCYECDICLSAFINCPVYSVAFGYQNRRKYIKCRHPDCPIGAILPEGHGRLVDIDKQIERIPIPTSGASSADIYHNIQAFLESAVTIVPAEAERSEA